MRTPTTWVSPNSTRKFFVPASFHQEGMANWLRREFPRRPAVKAADHVRLVGERTLDNYIHLTSQPVARNFIPMCTALGPDFLLACCDGGVPWLETLVNDNTAAIKGNSL